TIECIFVRHGLAAEIDVPVLMPVPAIDMFHLFLIAIGRRRDQISCNLFPGKFAISPPRHYTDVLLVHVLVTNLLRTILVSRDFEHNGLSIQCALSSWSGV